MNLGLVIIVELWDRELWFRQKNQDLRPPCEMLGKALHALPLNIIFQNHTKKSRCVHWLRLRCLSFSEDPFCCLVAGRTNMVVLLAMMITLVEE